MKKYIIPAVIATACLILYGLLTLNAIKERSLADSRTVSEKITAFGNGEENEAFIVNEPTKFWTIDFITNSENDSYEDAVVTDDSDEDSVVTDDSDEDSVITDGSNEDSAITDDPYVAPVVTDDMYAEFEDQIDIYNSVALNKFLGPMHITITEINEAIDNNDNIDDQWKEMLKEFANRIISYYPELDMRLFYENVKRLSIEYESSAKLAAKEKTAYYNPDEGIIHVNEALRSYISDYDRMVIRHEFAHLISIGILESDTGKPLICLTNNGDYGFYLREAIAVIISTKPYEHEYSFTDLGYGINTHELDAVISVIPDFDISVLANQDVYDIARYLDQVNPNSVSASRFIDLMDKQTIDYYGFSPNEPVTETEPEDFKDIYRYIANTYVNYVLNENMSRGEIQQISTTIKENLIRDLDDTYEHVGIEEIDNIFEEYMADHGCDDT